MLNALMTLATAISPAHGRAVGDYLIEFAGMGPDDPEFAEAFRRTLISLLGEVMLAAQAVEPHGGEIVLMAIDRSPEFAPVAEFRAEADQALSNLRMVHGFFVEGDGKSFWPN